MSDKSGMELPIMPLSAPPDHAAASADLPTSERVVFAGVEASRQSDGPFRCC